MEDKIVKNHFNNENLLYLFWAIPVIEVILYPSTIGNSLTIIIPILYTIYSFLRQGNKILVHSIPFFCLLSPIGQRYGDTLYSEFFLILIVIVVVLKLFSGKKFFINRNELPIFMMFCFFIISYATSFHYQELWKGLLNGIFLSSSFIITRIYIRNINDILSFIWSYAMAVCLATVLMVSFYFYGIRLNDLNGNIDIFNLINDPSNLVVNRGLDGLMNASATYFYTGIFYILSSTIVLIPIFFIYAKSLNQKIQIIFLSIIIITGVIYNFNKTAIIALTIVATIYLFRGFFKKSVVYVFSILSISIFAIWIFTLQAAFSYRGFELSSLYARFNVYQSSLSVLLDNIYILAFGLGPESAFRLEDNRIYEEAKTHSGISEGAIDSAYFSYLFEYGIFFVLIFLIYGVSMMYQLLIKNKNLIRNKNFQSIKFSFGLLFFTIYLMCVTQVLGLGKMAILIFQLFACSHVLINLKKQK
tara:strand:- start:406 stop:1824 length:1419 start_codon:yes stop_codon:yes gene_type:complete